ncbi:hypothetical protein [Nitrososphaera sp.]|uniref:hypothetical protein n=1 Tax=Nitrososphaera sp. TaxID=1971748 RepID=UPI00307E5448
MLATDKNRLSVEAIGRKSFANNHVAGAEPRHRHRDGVVAQPGFIAVARAVQTNVQQPLAESARREALEAVEKQLVPAGLLGRIGNELRISPVTQKKFSFELSSSLPTPGMYVTGCLDQCNICEKRADGVYRAGH